MSKKSDKKYLMIGIISTAAIAAAAAAAVFTAKRVNEKIHALPESIDNEPTDLDEEIENELSEVEAADNPSGGAVNAVLKAEKELSKHICDSAKKIKSSVAATTDNVKDKLFKGKDTAEKAAEEKIQDAKTAVEKVIDKVEEKAEAVKEATADKSADKSSDTPSDEPTEATE